MMQLTPLFNWQPLPRLMGCYFIEGGLLAAGAEIAGGVGEAAIGAGEIGAGALAAGGEVGADVAAGALTAGEVGAAATGADLGVLGGIPEVAGVPAEIAAPTVDLSAIGGSAATPAVAEETVAAGVLDPSLGAAAVAPGGWSGITTGAFEAAATPVTETAGQIASGIGQAAADPAAAAAQLSGGGVVPSSAITPSAGAVTSPSAVSGLGGQQIGDILAGQEISGIPGETFPGLPGQPMPGATPPPAMGDVNAALSALPGQPAPIDISTQPIAPTATSGGPTLSPTISSTPGGGEGMFAGPTGAEPTASLSQQFADVPVDQALSEPLTGFEPGATPEGVVQRGTAPIAAEVPPFTSGLG